MAVSATLVAQSGRRHDALAFYGLLVAFVVATQVVYTPTRDLGPDNTWHYRFASDIVTGVPVYWAGLDGNRLFPDLLFAIAAFVLSGQSAFAGWLPFFYALFFLALYASLIGLAATLYDRMPERRAFLLLSVAGLWAFELAAPFWPRWFFDPGNHGSGLPIAFACLALGFRMNKTGRFSLPAALIFVLAASLLVGSNRFLLIAFVLPLLGALLVALAGRWAVRQSYVLSTTARRDLKPLPGLIVTVCLAAVGSYFAYRSLTDLSWHKATTFMGVQIAHRDWSLDWAWAKLIRELGDLRDFFFHKSWQVIVGPLLLIGAIPPSLVLLVRATRRSARGVEENRVVFGLFSALAAVFSIAFVIWAWEEGTEWRYRYFAMATAYAVVFLATLLVRPIAALPRPLWIAAGALITLLALTLVPALHRETEARAARNRVFLGQVEGLKQWLGTQTSTRPLRGYGEYWAVMDITARTNLRLDLLNDWARARFYNNNAGALCLGRHSFILRKMRPDAPKRSEIVALLGEPRATREMELEGHQEVEIMVFDPAVIQSRITDEGKREAARLFPNFSCPP